MSAKTVEAAIKDGVKAAQGLGKRAGLDGLRATTEADWKEIAEAFWMRHAPANFKVSAAEGVLPAEEHGQYVGTFVLAASRAAEGILELN